MVMLMLDIAHPISVTEIFLRILHTIIGSFLAILGGYLLFPTWESRRLPRHIGEAPRTEAVFPISKRDRTYLSEIQKATKLKHGWP